MHGLAALCHEARKGGDTGSRSTYPMARLLSTRCLGERLKTAAMTENAIVKEIVDASFPDSHGSQARLAGIRLRCGLGD